MNEFNIEVLKISMENDHISIVFNICFFLFISIMFFIVKYLVKKNAVNGRVHQEIIPVTLKYDFGGQEIKYEIVRNYQNIEIAHKIYVELITRKAALPIDEKHDVIVEVYNSWYTLFQTTREELKSLPGKLLLCNNVSNDLIRLLTDILNKGLRPHLTEYQAKFRKWYDESLKLEENMNSIAI